MNWIDLKDGYKVARLENGITLHVAPLPLDGICAGKWRASVDTGDYESFAGKLEIVHICDTEDAARAITEKDAARIELVYDLFQRGGDNQAVYELAVENCRDVMLDWSRDELVAMTPPDRRA